MISKIYFNKEYIGDIEGNLEGPTSSGKFVANESYSPYEVAITRLSKLQSEYDEGIDANIDNECNQLLEEIQNIEMCVELPSGKIIAIADFTVFNNSCQFFCAL